jgi:2-polyprenyl-3-methyl-5-hydroxy-6-metoxy-1,4-benzoquinol methylase
MPSTGELNLFYSGSYYNFDRWHDEGKGAVFARRLSRWKLKGRFLDVGSARGFFIHSLRNHSQWDVYGIDFNSTVVQFACRELGLDVKQGDLTKAYYPECFFDYIHINNVLEHVLDPVSLLEECRRILKPDGRLFLSVPNGMTDVRTLIRFYHEEESPAYSHSGHIYFFSQEALLRMFHDAGFRVLRKKSGGFKRGLRNWGILPQKKTWKQDYFPRDCAPSSGISAIPFPSLRRYPDWYYRYRFIQSSFMNVPGLFSFGLDFIFLLRRAEFGVYSAKADFLSSE